MKYSIPQLYFFLLLFLGLIGLFLVVLFSSFLYRFSVDRVLEERAVNLQTLSTTIGSPFWVHQEILHIPGTIENFLQQTARVSDIVFIRIVNIETGVIEKSSDRKEVGEKVSNLPSFTKDVRIRDAAFNGSPIKELTTVSKNGDHLWMGVSLQETQRNVLLSGISLGLALLFLFGIAGLLILLVFDRAITRPLLLLMRGFSNIEEENYDIRLTKTTSVEMQRVFRSFNKTVARIHSARERDATVSRLKSEFISLVAHQLRTPLSILKWILNEDLAGTAGKLTKELRENLEKANITNERMITLVNDLLDVVEIEEGRFNYSFTPHSVSKIVENAVEDIRIFAKSRAVHITLHKPSQELPSVLLDAAKFRLSFDNILENAIVYTPKDGQVNVNISKDQKGSILLSVQDTGIGIEKTDMLRLFTKFFRSKNATEMYTSGSGLGLFIAKNITERHGGKIWIESEVGKGTIVYLTIPIKSSASSA